MTYYQWIETFHHLKTSPRDTKILAQLQKSTLEVNGNILYRFIQQLNDLIRTRLKNTLEDFLFKVNGIYQDTNLLSLEIIHIKKELKFAKELTKLNVIPKENQEQFQKTLQAFADEIMETLELSIQGIDATGEAITMIKNSKINNLEDEHEL